MEPEPEALDQATVASGNANLPPALEAREMAAGISPLSRLCGLDRDTKVGRLLINSTARYAGSLDNNGS